MANKTTGGVGPQGLSEIEGLSALIEDLENASTAGKNTSKSLKDLNKRMDGLSKEAKKSKDPVTVLSKGFVKLKEGSKEAGTAIDAFSKQIEDSVGVMTTSSAKALNETIENIKKMRADMVASGKGDSREGVMATAKLSQLQMQKYNDEKNFMIERAKNMQRSLNPLKMVTGVGFGVFNAGAKNAVMGAEAVGKAMGLSSGVMMAVTKVLIAVTLPFLSFIFAAKKSSKMMSEMAEGGDTMSGSLDKMRRESIAYHHEVADASKDSKIVFKDMQELMVTMNQEYGRSLGLGAAFAGNVANVGKTFGMTNEESVKLATKMAVLARTSSQVIARNAFGFLGLQAAKLKLPLDALADPMIQLAELAGRTGRDLNSAAGGMAMMLQAADSLRESGVKVFQNMKPADIAKFTKEFSGFITGIDEWQLAAMTFNQNESFQGMTERVAGMDSAARVTAIGQMMKDYNLQGRGAAAELGMILGAKNPSEALSRGLMAQGAVNGGMTDTQYNMLLAKDINKQLAERKTAGEAIQFGTDPTAFMMDRVQKILESIINIQDAILWWKNYLGLGQKGSIGTTSTATKPPASSSYGTTTVQPKRPMFSVPVGP